MIQFSTSGLTINTFEETLEEVKEEFRGRFGTSIKTSLDSTFGQIIYILALREQQIQERTLAMYQALDPRLAEGVHLDQRNMLLGIERLAPLQAEVLGTAIGDPTTSIPNGLRLSVGGHVFEVIDGPYVIDGGGTITNVRLQSQEFETIDVSVLGAWSIVDTLSGLDSFDDDSQPILGRSKENHADFRIRADVERFRRSSNSLDAIEASVSTVTGVEYVRAWHNITTDPVDADGIPYHAINVVVDGGDDESVAQAIWDAGPGGHLFYGTDVTVEIIDGPATHDVSFDRVAEIDVWAEVTLTTSTSEEVAPDDLEALVQTLLVEHTTANWTIGTDVLPYRLSGALAGIAGVDNISIEVSLDDGSSDPYSTAKRAMNIRQRPVLTAARITVIEV